MGYGADGGEFLHEVIEVVPRGFWWHQVRGPTWVAASGRRKLA